MKEISYYKSDWHIMGIEGIYIANESGVELGW